MVYTKFGPFVNGSPAALSSALFNAIDTTLANLPQLAPSPTGVAATDTANLLAAISTVQGMSDDLVLQGGTYALNSGLTWNANKGNLLSTGDVVLDFSAMTTGVALTVTGNNSSSNGYYSHVGVKYSISGFRMNGPNTDGTSVDGVLFTDPGVGIDYPTLAHVYVSGFRDNITFGNNTWSHVFQSVYSTNAHRYGLNLTSGTNSGECVTWIGGGIAGCKNAAGTAIGVYSPPSGGSVDFKMLAGSIDYNDNGMFLQSGNQQFFGTHIEDNNQTPFGKFANQSGAAPLNVDFIGCTYGPTESTARDHLWEIVSSNSDRITINFTGGGGVKYNANTTFLIDNSGLTTGGISVGISNPYVSGGGPANGNVNTFGDYFNQLTNGAFEDSTSFVSAGVAGWTAGGTYTWTIGTGSPRSGTNALQVVGTGQTATSTTYQKLTLNGRRAIDVTAWMRSAFLSAGNVGVYVQFFSVDQTTAIQGPYRVGSVLSTATGGVYVAVQRRITPPRGAAYAQMQVTAANLNGTVQIDDIQVTQL